MATIHIPDELANRIKQGAQRAGETSEAFLSEAVLSRLEDIAVATERLKNPSARIPFEQVKRDLGLDD